MTTKTCNVDSVWWPRGQSGPPWHGSMTLLSDSQTAEGILCTQSVIWPRRTKTDHSPLIASRQSRQVVNVDRDDPRTKQRSGEHARADTIVNKAECNLQQLFQQYLRLSSYGNEREEEHNHLLAALSADYSVMTREVTQSKNGSYDQPILHTFRLYQWFCIHMGSLPDYVLTQRRVSLCTLSDSVTNVTLRPI